ncbi:6-bladed beta-propeller [Bacteroides nordii]|uniref:6-bladed beta-propeller n=1 Tax=Bacteroides nordii TaxID=291645 RepID=UPI0034A37EE4
MRKILYILVCAMFSFSSCKRNVNIREIAVSDSLFQVIVIDPNDINRKEPFKISTIVEKIEYVPLQTADTVLMGKMNKLIVWNDQFYIWDQLTEAIFCFNSKGQFLHKIHKQGKGPDEYPRIYDFTMDMTTGDIYIYSDMSKTIYAYTEKGEFIRKMESPFILSSFGIQGNYTYYYLGRTPNADFYSETFPEQCRYVVMENDEFKHEQLKYIFDDKYLQIPSSRNVFSFYKDTMLLVEYLKPEIYSIDSIGRLRPKYRIEFLTNTYSPSFNEEIDLERMESEKKNGNLTTLFNAFFETDDYLFFNYARGIIGSAYVNKKDRTIHNMGYFLMDDFNQNSLPSVIDFVDENYMYKSVEPASLIRRQLKGNFSPYLDGMVENMREFDNPVIIKIKLK